MKNAHSLQLFAYHIFTLAKASPGDKYGLCLGGICVEVRVDAHGMFYLTLKGTAEESCGNAYGAVAVYTRMVAADCGLAD